VSGRWSVQKAGAPKWWIAWDPKRWDDYEHSHSHGFPTFAEAIVYADRMARAVR